MRSRAISPVEADEETAARRESLEKGQGTSMFIRRSVTKDLITVSSNSLSFRKLGLAPLMVIVGMSCCFIIHFNR